MEGTLARITQAKTALMNAKTLDDVLNIRDQAEAVRVYAKAAQEGLEAQNAAAEIKLRAERMAGECLKEMEKAKNQHSATSSLEEATGIKATQSHRWQKSAELPIERFEQLVYECAAEQKELTQALVLKAVNGAHVGNNSGENEWYTPADFIECARDAMGSIDLDPASCETANEVVQAATFFDEQANGLEQEWGGNVWLNPPYAQPLILYFIKKLAESDVKQACVLVNNATDTEWFQTLLGVSSALCLPRGRVRFWSPGKKKASPLQGQAVAYIGPRVESFCSYFGSFGTVLEVTNNG